MALLNEINVKGVPHSIVTDDGYYQEMTVGDAEQLVATTFTEDDAPYNFRTAGGAIDIGDRKQVEGIVGGTVAWNQLAKFGTNASNYNVVSDYEIKAKTDLATATYPSFSHVWNGAHKCLVRIKNSTSTNLSFYTDTAYTQSYVVGSNTESEKILSITSVMVENNNPFLAVGTGVLANESIKANIIDLTAMFGTTIADYIYSLEQSNAGAGVAWFKKLFPKPYYAYNAGELMSVKALRHITRGFNAFDVANADLQQKNWENIYTVSQNVHTEGYTKVIAGATYCFHQNIEVQGRYIRFYDADYNWLESDTISIYNNNDYVFTVPANAMYLRLMWYDANGVSVAEVQNGEITINLRWDGERDGEYEEYVEHIYELDPDLELRGIPKLSAGNDLYYDGDVYEPDGTVTRKYGVVDLGTLTWVHSISNRSVCTLADIKAPSSTSVLGNYITSKGYKQIVGNGTLAENGEYAVIQQQNNVNIYFYYDGINLPTGYMVYELATSTEESADPYNGTQIVDDFGTEEYVDAGVAGSTRDVSIPVGHNSLYQPNLRAKLEMVPEAPEDNGYYVVYHHDGINEYVPLIIPQELPELPTEDGTYTLKCTVASGSATLSFESEV